MDFPNPEKEKDCFLDENETLEVVYHGVRLSMKKLKNMKKRLRNHELKMFERKQDCESLCPQTTPRTYECKAIRNKGGSNVNTHGNYIRDANNYSNYPYGCLKVGDLDNHVTMQLLGYTIDKAIIDGRSTINVMPKITWRAIGSLTMMLAQYMLWMIDPRAKNDESYKPNIWGEIEIDNSLDDNDSKCFIVNWLQKAYELHQLAC
eukprot:Gb_07157 [translate_table: standard]